MSQVGDGPAREGRGGRDLSRLRGDGPAGEVHPHRSFEAAGASPVLVRNALKGRWAIRSTPSQGNPAAKPSAHFVGPWAVLDIAATSLSRCTDECARP